MTAERVLCAQYDNIKIMIFIYFIQQNITNFIRIFQVIYTNDLKQLKQGKYSFFSTNSRDKVRKLYIILMSVNVIS